MKVFVALIVLASAVSASLDCPVSERFPWIESTLSVGIPWSEYTSPNSQCCDEVNPDTEIDFDVECALCYGRTQSTPGFMLDPNNCQKFYMCVPNGDGFDAHSMTCPDCMFWDDNKLSCVEVDDSCRVSVSVETGTPNPLFIHDSIVSCIDFENDEVLSTKGMYVFNNGVSVVENGVDVADDFCPEGNRCGFFNASQLEIPFFSNNYNHLPNLRITFRMYATTDMERTEGVVSNDCLNGADGASGNSIYYSIDNGVSESGIVDANDNSNTTTVNFSTNEWTDVTIDFDGSRLSLSVDGVSDSANLVLPFTGIRESHCPLVLGSFIKEASSTYFQGYLDNVCISINYEATTTTTTETPTTTEAPTTTGET